MPVVFFVLLFIFGMEQGKFWSYYRGNVYLNKQNYSTFSGESFFILVG